MSPHHTIRFAGLTLDFKFKQSLTNATAGRERRQQEPERNPANK